MSSKTQSAVRVLRDLQGNWLVLTGKNKKREPVAGEHVYTVHGEKNGTRINDEKRLIGIAKEIHKTRVRAR